MRDDRARVSAAARRVRLARLPHRRHQHLDLDARTRAGERVYCGHRLPDGLRKHERLPRPLLTPTTKAEHGAHDELTSRESAIERGLVAAARYDEAEAMVLRLFAEGQQWAEKQGVILVDTKYELGLDDAGTLTVIDEIHTPDSSRYWYLDSYERAMSEGADPKAMDKEFVRRWLAERGYQGEGAPPALPDELRCEAARRYIETYERITGLAFVPDTRTDRCSGSVATSDSPSVFAVVQFPGSNDDRDMRLRPEERARRATRARLAQGRRAARRARTACCSPVASRTATTCAAARWRASRRSWRRSALRRRRRAGARAPATASRCSARRACCRARCCATAASHFVCEPARARRAGGGAVHVAGDARAGVAHPDEARRGPLPRHAGGARAPRGRRAGGGALLHARRRRHRTPRTRTARSGTWPASATQPAT